MTQHGAGQPSLPVLDLPHEAGNQTLGIEQIGVGGRLDGLALTISVKIDQSAQSIPVADHGRIARWTFGEFTLDGKAAFGRGQCPCADDAVDAQMPRDQRDEPSFDFHIVPRFPSAIVASVLHADLLAVPAGPVVVVVFGQGEA